MSEQSSVSRVLAHPATQLVVVVATIEDRHLSITIERERTCLGRFILEELCTLKDQTILIGEHRLRPEFRR